MHSEVGHETLMMGGAALVLCEMFSGAPSIPEKVQAWTEAAQSKASKGAGYPACCKPLGAVITGYITS